MVMIFVHSVWDLNSKNKYKGAHLSPNAWFAGSCWVKAIHIIASGNLTVWFIQVIASWQTEANFFPDLVRPSTISNGQL